MTFLVGAPLFAIVDLAGIADRMREAGSDAKSKRSLPQFASEDWIGAPDDLVQAEEQIASPLPSSPPHVSVSAGFPPADPDVARDEIVQRLKDAGALYMRLDAVRNAPNEANKYCFLCDMPGQDGGASPRRFEACGDLPEAAMRQVLEDVQSWRKGLLR